MIISSFFCLKISLLKNEFVSCLRRLFFSNESIVVVVECAKSFLPIIRSNLYVNTTTSIKKIHLRIAHNNIISFWQTICVHAILWNYRYLFFIKFCTQWFFFCLWNYTVRHCRYKQFLKKILLQQNMIST